MFFIKTTVAILNYLKNTIRQVIYALLNIKNNHIIFNTPQETYIGTYLKILLHKDNFKISSPSSDLF